MNNARADLTHFDIDVSAKPIQRLLSRARRPKSGSVDVDQIGAYSDLQ